MGGKEGKGRKGPQVDQDNGPEFENRNEVRRWTGSGPAADRRHSGLGLVSEGVSEEIKKFSIRKNKNLDLDRLTINFTLLIFLQKSDR